MRLNQVLIIAFALSACDKPFWKILAKKESAGSAPPAAAAVEQATPGQEKAAPGVKGSDDALSSIRRYTAGMPASYMNLRLVSAEGKITVYQVEGCDVPEAAQSVSIEIQQFPQPIAAWNRKEGERILCNEGRKLKFDGGLPQFFSYYSLCQADGRCYVSGLEVKVTGPSTGASEANRVYLPISRDEAAPAAAVPVQPAH